MQVGNVMLNNIFNEEDGKTLSHSHPPPQDPNPDETDAFFARELNKLSIKERDEVLQDVHGVSDVMSEDPTFVRQFLKDLDLELAKIPDADKAGYLQAKQQNPEYVRDEEFLLMFLRADSFDVRNAATRLLSFFQAKLELFGPDKLGKDITLDDLSQDDIECLESGYCQVLPGRDRAGRAIFTLLPQIRKFRCIENKVCTILILFLFLLFYGTSMLIENYLRSLVSCDRFLL
jgi:hypothetical protein